jgi:hypothetical protein
MSGGNHEPEEIEYVGAPTEFADAQEVPEWVANVARVLFFLPTAFVTATTIPFIMLGIILVCCVLCGVLVAQP